MSSQTISYSVESSRLGRERRDTHQKTISVKEQKTGEILQQETPQKVRLFFHVE